MRRATPRPPATPRLRRAARPSPPRLLLATALVLALAAPGALAQLPMPALPHPSDQVTHHPLTIEAELRELAAVNADFAEVRTFGASSLGFPLWLIDIHAPGADRDALPVYYLDGAHHGNEQLGMEALLHWLRELMVWSATEEGAARLAEVRVVVAPMINPDGVAKDARGNLNNVDLNRNYPFHWGLYGTSDDPTGSTYRGSAPASEPETRANIALMEDLHPDVYLSMHTGSHDIVLPWRADEDGPYPDWAVYEAFLAGIEEVSGLGYRDPSGAGESISHGYGAFGAVSLIVEVSEVQFQPVFTEDLAAMLREEIAIFWHGLEMFERLGGHLQVAPDAAVVTNAGFGPAWNVTFHTADGSEAGFLPSLDPGASAPLPAGAVHASYLRRAQGEEAPQVWGLDLGEAAALALASDGSGGGLSVPGPGMPALMAGLAGAALAVSWLRRGAAGGRR